MVERQSRHFRGEQEWCRKVSRNSNCGEREALSVVQPGQFVGERHGSWLDLLPVHGKRGPGLIIHICHSGQAGQGLQRSESAGNPFSQRNDC